MAGGTRDGDSGRLVGRVEELRQLGRLLLAARTRTRIAASVTGEPGIGKTRLLREVGTRARSSGFDLVQGRGSELERDVPYGLVADALDERLGGLAPHELRRLGDECVSDLGTVLPSLATWTQQQPTGLEVERHRCHRAIRLALQLLAARRPLLLVLDDIHWADHASIEVIAHLIRHGVPRMVLLLGLRAHQAPRPLLTALARSAREDGLRSFELGVLSIEEAAELLRTPATVPRLRELYTESGGNPFYLRQLARTPQGRGSALAGEPASGHLPHQGVPAAMQAGLTQELDALSSAALRLLQAGAVAGEPFDLDLAAQIAELGEADAHAAVDELFAGALLRGSDVPGRLRFRHPVVRRMIYDQAGYGWQRMAHRRALAVQTDRRAGICTRAHHAERCAEVGDEDAIAILMEAAQVATRRAPDTAAGWYKAALRLLPDEAPCERRVPLLVALAGSLTTIGRLRDAGNVLQQALEALPPDAAERRGQITVMIARIEHGLGNTLPARRLLTTTLASVDPDGAQAAALELELARNHIMMRQWDEAATLVAHACALAEQHNDRRLLLTSRALGAVLEHVHSADALADADEAEADVDAFGADVDAFGAELDALAADVDTAADDELAMGLLDALPNLVYAELCLERWSAAAERARYGLRLSGALGQGAHVVEIMHLLAVAQRMMGQLDEAQHTIDNAVEATLFLDSHAQLARMEGTRCWILSLRGRTNEALAAGERAVQAAERVPDASFVAHAHLCYGLALIDAGRPRQGRAEMHKAGGAQLSHALVATRPPFLRALVDAEVALGLMAVAEETTLRVEAITETMTDLPMRKADARAARAALLLARGEPRQAASAAAEAATLYETSDTPIEAARARLLLGRAHLQVNERAAAARELEAARSAFEDCGAARLADQAGRELRRIRSAAGVAGVAAGSGLRRRAAGSMRRQRGLDDLTDRQIAIVRRVALGYTNRRISEELHVSEKTVEAHLTRLFAKLGVSSRAALAATVVDRTGPASPLLQP